MSSAASAQPPGQPQSKASPIAQLTGPQAPQASDEIVAKPIQASNPRLKAIRGAKEANSSDSASVHSTVALIQRVLAPQRHTAIESPLDRSAIEDVLPPLTSSNEVDLELYAILAIIVKDFVNTWYTKITPDHGFVDEIVQIVAHCSRALEQRLRHIDFAALLLDEIPLLVQTHVETYRVAKANTNYSPYAHSLRHIYHELRPHPALEPLPSDHTPSTVHQQELNERAYRQLLVQGALAVLLPTEDLQNDPLRVLVGDIIADLIIGQALAGKVCNGWFLHDAISKVTAVLSDKVQPKASGSELHDEAKNRLEKFGLLSPDPKFPHDHSLSDHQSKIAAWFWRIMQYGYLLYLFLRYVLKEFNTIHSRPKRHPYPRNPQSPVDQVEQTQSKALDLDDHATQPVLAFGIYGMLSTLLRLDNRMPWASSTLKFLQHNLLCGKGQIAKVDSSLDRFLCHAIETHVLPPSLLPMILRNLRVALFPNNSMGPPAPPPPSPEERRAIKRAAAKSLRDLVPMFVTHRFYATSDDEVVADEIERDILDSLDDVYLNKHLVYAILELVIVKLIPELLEQPVSDLLAERGVGVEDPNIDGSNLAANAENNTKDT